MMASQTVSVLTTVEIVNTVKAILRGFFVGCFGFFFLFCSLALGDCPIVLFLNLATVRK